MLTDQFLQVKCAELWSMPCDVKGDGGKTNVEFKTRAGRHPDFELTNQIESRNVSWQYLCRIKPVYTTIVFL